MLDALGSWPGALLLQRSGTAYLLVNALHILGIGLLLGAILPLDLRLLGLFRATPLAFVGPFLSRAALVGVCVALASGFVLFTVKPTEYLRNEAFLIKLPLIGLALANVAVQHLRPGYRLALAGGPVDRWTRWLAGVSAALWLSVLIIGRWIGFA